jgi:prophage antirepressor-like protein
MTALHKGSVGRFQYWLVGKMQWEIRSNGLVLATETNLSKAAARAQYFYDLEKSGDVWGILASVELAAKAA